MDNGFKHSVVEALILASPEPLPARKIAGFLDGMTLGKVGQVVAELNNRYMLMGSSYRIREIAGGYQVYIMPEFGGYVQELFARRRKLRFTRAALETLAIVAYRQPVTKPDIEYIRGVASDGVIHNLLQKSMITIKGRAGTVGKPLQYGTTDEFLKFFGLNRLEDLPKMSEIEELIAGDRSQTQTELRLADPGTVGEENVKLNIADGTYDPDRGAKLDEVTGEPVSVSEKDDSDSGNDALRQGDEPTLSDDSDNRRSDVTIDTDAT